MQIVDKSSQLILDDMKQSLQRIDQLKMDYPNLLDIHPGDYIHYCKVLQMEQDLIESLARQLVS